MEIDEMWDAFQKSRSIKKTSIAEKLDTIAAQNNEIQTDLARVSKLVPKILGDDAAIEASDAQTPPMGMMPGGEDMGAMGGAPPIEGGAIPGAEEMGPDGMDLGTGDGMIDTDEPQPGAPMPGDEEISAEMPEEAPMPEEGAVPEEGVPEEDVPLSDDIGLDLADDTGMEPEPMDDGMGGDPTIDVLLNMLHEKVDEGNMDEVKALADAIEQLGGGAGGMEGIYDNEEPLIPMDETSPIKLSANPTGIDGSAVTDMAPSSLQQSDNDSTKSDMEKVMGILNEAQAEVAEVLTDSETSEDEPEEEGAVEIEIEAEPEPEETEEEESPEEDSSEEESPKKELSEDGEAPFTESNDCTDDMDATVSMKPKSVQDLTYREIFEARMNGRDLIAERIQKSAGVTNGYNEFDPWGLTRRSEMFVKADLESADNSGALTTTLKSETVADEVDCPKSVMSGKHDGTDPATVADDIKEPMDHTKGSAPGGDMIDDVDEKKGASDHSVDGGAPLDDVDEKKGTSDHDVDNGDLLDDIDEKKGASENSSESKDLLDDVDKLKKTAADTGVPVMSIKDMMAIKKNNKFAVSRPDNVATFGGNYERPTLGKLQKSTTTEPVKMGRGVDPHKVVEADWAEYNLYKAQVGL